MVRQNQPWQVAALVALILILGTGCQTMAEPQPLAETPVSPYPQERSVDILLYFSDAQGEYLHPEWRAIFQRNESIPQLIVQELINGPKMEDLLHTLPEGTRLLALEIKEGIAYLNFSKELRSKHSGGTTGELMTIYSLVNSLTELEEVEMVQLLLEGRVEETIFGHIETGVPIGRNESIIYKPE